MGRGRLALSHLEAAGHARAMLYPARMIWLRPALPMLLLAAAPAPLPEAEPMMDRIEAAIAMPAGAGPLADYGRYYALESRTDGVRKVVAVYVREPSPRRHWVDQNALPLVMDGGCDIVTLTYDFDADRIERVECNGEG